MFLRSMPARRTSGNASLSLLSDGIQYGPTLVLFTMAAALAVPRSTGRMSEA